MGFVAHIPHYVAQLDYPLASTKLLEAVEVVTGLEWDTEPLRVAGEERMVEIAAQIEDLAEVRDVVHGLEQQYDAFHRPDGDERCRWPRRRSCPRVRSSARSSSVSWPVSPTE